MNIVAAERVEEYTTLKSEVRLFSSVRSKLLHIYLLVRYYKPPLKTSFSNILAGIEPFTQSLSLFPDNFSYSFFIQLS